MHLSTLRRLGIPIVGVLGSSASRGAERARALGVAKAYSSLDELCADPAVQVVHVTSPNVAHYPQVKAILAAGKHVICEKPLVLIDGRARIDLERDADGQRAGQGADHHDHKQAARGVAAAVPPCFCTHASALAGERL